MEKNSSNATLPQFYSPWAVALLDAPQDAIPYYQINGLRVATNALDPISDIDIQAGSVRDYTDTVDLVLESSITKRLDALFAVGTNQGAATQSAPLTGAVSSSGLVVTGSGTLFTSHFGAGANGAKNNDLYRQGAVLGGVISPPVNESIISVGSMAVPVDTVSSNTSLTSYASLGAAPNSTFKRGGSINITLGGLVNYQYAICLGRRELDGLVDVFASAYTADGSVDLPVGFTHYRAIAELSVFPESNQNITMYLKQINAPEPSEITYPFGFAFSGGAAFTDDVFDTLIALDSATRDATTTSAGIVELATDAEMETGTDAGKVVTPGRQHRHPSAAKFWVSCGASGNIFTSYNVASVTDVGVGQITVTIANDFSSGNWAAFGAIETSQGDQWITMQNQTSGAITALDRDSSVGGLADPTTWFIGGFGDHPG